MKLHLKALAAACLSASLLFVPGCAREAAQPEGEPAVEPAPAAEPEPAPAAEPAVEPAVPSPYLDEWAAPEGYTLEKVVILSRHNIRSPLSGGGSTLALATPHEWFEWTSAPSELSLRGGANEAIMGQYFRTWLEAQGLFPENYRPEEGKVRIYANSLQRCLATAHFFSAGLLPVAEVEVESHMAYGEMDPVFNPRLTFMSEAYAQAALAQIAEAGGADDPSHATLGLEDEYALLKEVVDYEDSEGFASGDLADLVTDDSEFTLELDKEPAVAGSLKLATSLADALVLQYYEEEDPLAASFGHELSEDEWRAIGSIKDDWYTELLFGTPIVARNVAHPMLQELSSELDAEGRELSFLCGHDSNIASVLAALGVEDYELPDTIEPKTPIGSKLVIEVWKDADGNEWASLRLVYATTDQIRSMALLDEENPPASYALSLEGIEANGDGLYAISDLRERFREAIDAYDALAEQYADAEELPAAA